ncbi:MAG: urease accessory protein UreD [Verrucomicrobia bacterium]|nr:urease accessory protein UreD [Verrucomicrobiota bacterium]
MSEFSGHLALRAATRAHGRTVLAEQSFRAPYHLSKPYWDADARVLIVQVVNPTAGILSGDRLESDIAVDPDAALLVTTPSASRVFKMKDGAAACRQHFIIAPGGWLEVMPEPLVPHRGCSYHQSTTVEVAPGGEMFFADLLMPGRVAHGEAWEWQRLCLETTVRLGGELILRERFEQTGDGLRALATLAGSGPGACFGNAVLIAAERATDSEWRTAVSALHGEGLWVGVSALRRGGWSLKFVARDGVRLRRGLREARKILSAYFPRLTCDPRKL